MALTQQEKKIVRRMVKRIPEEQLDDYYDMIGASDDAARAEIDRFKALVLPQAEAEVAAATARKAEAQRIINLLS